MRMILMATVFFMTGDVMAKEADLLVTNGKILTSADAPSGTARPTFAQAALIHDGAFVAVGTDQEIKAEAKRLHLHAKTVDLHGRFALPGLTDAHGHVSSLGFSLIRLKLHGMTSPGEIAKLVAAETRRRKPGEWILGRGWDQNVWEKKEFPDRHILDMVAPDNPVWLTRVDGHAAWANSKAIESAGVTKETKDPEGGRIVRGADGSPSGVFIDNAVELVAAKVPTPTHEQRKEAIVRAAKECARLGLTCVHDPGIGLGDLAAYEELANAGKLPIRVRAMLSADLAKDPEKNMPRQKVTTGDGWFRVFGVKAYADGALGSRGAALLTPYADDPKNTGLLVTQPEELAAIARTCFERGYQMCTHAIGDRGNRIVLDTYEKAAGGPEKLKDRRFRIEHAQVVSLDDIPRFGADGVIASMQPTHCTSDMAWAPDRLGVERVKGAYAWRRMLNAGARLCFGSDFPIEEPNPLLGIYAAVTTQDVHGNPAAGYRPEEKMTIYEAIHGFTDWAAYAVFEEKTYGRLEVGMKGDLSVFDRDLTAVPPSEIPRAECLLTVVGGRIEHEAKL